MIESSDTDSRWRFFSLVDAKIQQDKHFFLLHYLHFMPASHLADTHTPGMSATLSFVLHGRERERERRFFHTSFRMKKNDAIERIYTCVQTVQSGMIIFYNAIYVDIKKFNANASVPE